MMPDPMASGAIGSLELRSLGKSFGQTVAVRDLSLAIGKGEFLTILGQSGSGKTTTLMMIAGFVGPDSGSILLDGRDLVGVPTYRRSIGVVFQSYALFPHMSVFDNVAFPLRMRDMSGREIALRVGRMLDLVQLLGLEQRKPSQLSGGQQQRVALARALVFEPSVLLLDEPLGALDRLLREEMKLELRRVHKELGTTMIYVTHDQDEALILSDRIAVMKDGQIEQVGAPDDIYRRPSNVFVAHFVGEGNLLPCEVITVDGEAAAVMVEGTQVGGVVSGTVRAGDRAMIFIRPEKIVLQRKESAGPALRGTVEDKLYGGELIRYHVRVNSARIVVKQASRFGVFLPEVGSPAALAWSTDDAVVFAVKP